VKKRIREEPDDQRRKMKQNEQNDLGVWTEMEKLRAEFASLQAQLEEIRAGRTDPDEIVRRDAMHQAIIDGLLAILVRNAGDLAEAQSSRIERDQLQGEVNRLREELKREQEMLSVRLVLRAKGLLDRVPRVRAVLKFFVRKLFD